MREQTTVYLNGNQTASYTSLRTDDQDIGYTGVLTHPKMTLGMYRKHVCKAGDITTLHVVFQLAVPSISISLCLYHFSENKELLIRLPFAHLRLF